MDNDEQTRQRWLTGTRSLVEWATFEMLSSPDDHQSHHVHLMSSMLDKEFADLNQYSWDGNADVVNTWTHTHTHTENVSTEQSTPVSSKKEQNKHTKGCRLPYPYTQYYKRQQNVNITEQIYSHHHI